jgi:predicted HTH transcriptional regulator
MKITVPAEVHKLIREGESQTLDFKKTITDPAKIARTLTSFANTEGGKIIVGVTDQGQVAGIDPAEEMFAIGKAAANYCFPPVVVWCVEEELDGLAILVVEVAVSPAKPHYIIDPEGRRLACRRVGDRTICDLAP